MAETGVLHAQLEMGSVEARLALCTLWLLGADLQADETRAQMQQALDLHRREKHRTREAVEVEQLTVAR